MTPMTTRSTYDGISHQEQRFVDGYARTLKIRDSMIAAGYAKSSAAGLGTLMMQRPAVALAISKALEEKSMLARIDASWVLKRLARLADFSIKNFIVVDDNGRLYYDFKAATPDDWYCINEVTVTAVRARHNADEKLWVDQVKIKTNDKMKALELVGKHVDVQAFKDRVDVSGTVQITEVTRKVVRPGELPGPDVKPVIDVTPEPHGPGTPTVSARTTP